MKLFWYLFSFLFITSLIFAYIDWKTGGFDFFVLQEQSFYFQSWISIAGILFALIMAITSFIIYIKSKLRSLKYIPLSFVLTAFAYVVIGYHASYCKVCSDLGFCAASHNYPNYLILIVLVVSILTAIMLSSNLDLEKKAQSLYRLSYGLIIATGLLTITLFFSIGFMEVPDVVSYTWSNNLQVVVFTLPIVIIVGAFAYFRRIYKAAGTYLFMGLLSSMCFVPQIYHIISCEDCHNLECSEFYVFSGLIMFMVVGLFIHAVSVQLQENKEQAK